jgi:hypothetical protein
MSLTDSPAANRRRNFRRRGKADLHVSCHLGAPARGANLALALLDASRGGVRLLLREVVGQGQDVTVRLAGPVASPLTRAGTVAWVVATPDGCCCVGVELTATLPVAAVASLTRPARREAP